ncbi:MAG: methyltransferase [Patescibacteria group bacterium]
MKYKIQGKNINLVLKEDVFSPSIHGSSALAENIKVNRGESVLDLGTGTGILAILAAKLGGQVTAVDVLPKAVALAKINFKKNHVTIRLKHGNLFRPVIKNKYDVIIANIPQENLSPKIIKSVRKEIFIGMHGGKYGNEILLNVLKNAPKHMHKLSRLYVVIYSMSNFRKSLQTIYKLYQAKLIHFYTGPVKNFIYDDLDWYESESRSGRINIYKKGNKYFADLFVFELTLK